MLETFAQRLQAMFAPDIPIVAKREQARQPPFLLHLPYGSGDMYSGSTSNETIHLELMRPRTGLLQVIFQYSLHELSGQCDDWSVTIAGAKEEERAPLRELFHPRQQTGHWNNHVEPRFEFNGAKSAYESRRTIAE